MKILETFDNFYKESLSVIRERVINLIFVNTVSSLNDNCCIYTQLKKNKETQITVFNNEKVYNLLTSAWEKHKKNLKNENCKI